MLGRNIGGDGSGGGGSGGGGGPWGCGAAAPAAAERAAANGDRSESLDRRGGGRPRKRPLSAVVVDGEQRAPSVGARSSSGDGGAAEEGEVAAGAAGARPSKRPARPQDVARSKRLLGSLLVGTLQRFK